MCRQHPADELVAVGNRAALTRGRPVRHGRPLPAPGRAGVETERAARALPPRFALSIAWASGRNTVSHRAARGLAARRRVPAMIAARMAVAITVLAVAAGALGAPAALTGPAARPAAAHRVITLDAARGSGSARRAAARGSGTPAGRSGTAAGRPGLYPRQIARGMLRSFGWGTWEFRSLNKLWSHESGWRVHADNPYTGAYGIPQAVPGSKMASAGVRWRTSAEVQIRWGLGYIKLVYGSPWHAWQHELGTGWYGHRARA